MTGGLVHVAREIFDHPAFEPEPFTEREAWVWLIMEAQWKPCRKRIAGKAVSLKRGQLSHSVRFMADKWIWHRARVSRFLDRLKRETMIETASETGQNVITICNYETYQDYTAYRETARETGNETAARQQRDKEEHQITPEEHQKEDIRPNKDDISKMVDGWNALADECGLGRVQRITPKRQRAAPLRLNDLGGLAGWEACLDKIRGSPFLLGSSGWRVTFDWVMSPNNLTKIMEGNYDSDKPTETAETRERTRRAAMLEAAGALADSGQGIARRDKPGGNSSGAGSARRIEPPSDSRGIARCVG